MAKGAAKEATLGALHSKLATVFTKVLEKYERGLDAINELPADQIEADLIEAIADIAEPSPAMLSAVAKFLKDNEIGLDSEEIEKLNSTARRLEDRRAQRRAAGINLSVVPAVEHD